MNNDEIVKLVYRKDYDALRQAIANGANLNSVDRDGRTPLMHAVLDNGADAEMVRFLITNGANPAAVDKGRNWTSLHFAARDQKLPIVEVLLTAGAAVDAVDALGNTPLLESVMGSAEVVRLLLSKGADPHKKNRHGVSAKDLAERAGKKELAALFGA